MKTVLMSITPAMARRWLEFNTENRRLRPNVVDNLRKAWDRGEWKTTHQGIAFSKSGRLLDGQHRLTFISHLPEDAVVQMNVTADCDDDLFGAIDQGQARTLSDVTGMSNDLVAVGRLLARVQNGSTTQGLTPQYVTPFIRWAEPEFVQLLTFSPGRALVWSSASVRAAAIYQMKQGHDEDYIKVSYDALIRSDIDAMPHAARALMQQRLSGKIVSARSLDLFCRALRAFDSTKKGKIKSILVVDQAGTLAEVRANLEFLAKKSPTVVGQKVAKPSANSKVSRLSAAA